MKNYKKRFSAISAVLLGLNLFAPAFVGAESTSSNDSSVFKDVSHHWASQSIQEWVKDGFIKGYEDGTFRPDKGITRAEFVTLVNHAFGFTEKAPINFKDIHSADWFYDSIAEAKAAGYISGYEDGTMRPNNEITRQEAAVIISKVMNLAISQDTDALQQFSDRSSIENWSKAFVNAVVNKGYMKGYPDHTYQPKHLITRAESVVTLDHALKDKVPTTTFDKAGVNGPANSVQTINGNVVISSADVTLQNTVITGNLLITQEVGDGNVYLKNVTVKGSTTILGGGMHSVVVENSTLGKVDVNKKTGGVRVLATGKTKIGALTLESGAKLEEKDLQDVGFTTVDVASDTPAGAAIILASDIDEVDVDSNSSNLQVTQGTIDSLHLTKQASGTQIDVASGSTINSVTVDSAVSFTGKGTIKKATVNVNGTSFAQKPLEVVTADGVKVTYGTASTGGGGGGGGTTPTFDINTAGSTNNGDYTINQSSSVPYGPASGSPSIIHGKLILDPGPTGTIYLRNVQADNIVVKSGASDSIHLNGVTVTGDLTVEATEPGQTTPVHVVTEGNTTIAQTTVKSKVKLESNATGSSKGFGNVTIDPEATGTVQLAGTINGTVTVASGVSGVTLAVSSSANVSNIDLQSPISLQTESGSTVGGITLSSSSAMLNLTGTGTVQSVTVSPAAAGATLNLSSETAAHISKLVISANVKLEGNIGSISIETTDPNLKIDTSGLDDSSRATLKSNAINRAIAAINALGTITLAKEADVISARNLVNAAKAFDASDSDITNLPILVAAENTINSLKANLNPVITGLSFGTIASTEDGNVIQADITPLTQDLLNTTVTVSKNSTLTLNLKGIGQVGVYALKTGDNTLAGLSVPAFNTSTMDFSKVNFRSVFNAIKATNIDRSVLLNDINFTAIFDTIKNGGTDTKTTAINGLTQVFSDIKNNSNQEAKSALLNSVNFSGIINVLHDASTTEKLNITAAIMPGLLAAAGNGTITSDDITTAATNSDYYVTIFSKIKSAPADKQAAIFDAMDFTTLFDTIINSSDTIKTGILDQIHFTDMFNGLALLPRDAKDAVVGHLLDTITALQDQPIVRDSMIQGIQNVFTTLHSSTGVPKAILNMLAPLDSDGNDKVLTLTATLTDQANTSNSTEYTIKLTLQH
jgi:hypothetical protein